MKERGNEGKTGKRRGKDGKRRGKDGEIKVERVGEIDRRTVHSLQTIHHNPPPAIELHPPSYCSHIPSFGWFTTKATQSDRMPAILFVERLVTMYSSYTIHLRHAE